MDTPSTTAPSRPLLGIAMAVAIGAGLLAVLAGWAMYGTAILYTYAQDGLAWCF